MRSESHLAVALCTYCGPVLNWVIKKWPCHRQKKGDLLPPSFLAGWETIQYSTNYSGKQWRKFGHILSTGTHEENWSRRLPVSWSTQHTGGSNRSCCLESRSDKSCHILLSIKQFLLTVGDTVALCSVHWTLDCRFEFKPWMGSYSHSSFLHLQCRSRGTWTNAGGVWGGGG